MKGILTILCLSLLLSIVTNAQSLSQAVQAGNATLVSQLLAGGANVNETDSLGNTPLILATEAGNLQIDTLLIQSGANVNLATSSGKTALIFAAENGYIDIVTVLYNSGASAKYQNPVDKNMRAFDYLVEEEGNWNNPSPGPTTVDFVAVFNLLSLATH